MSDTGYSFNNTALNGWNYFQGGQGDSPQSNSGGQAGSGTSIMGQSGNVWPSRPLSLGPLGFGNTRFWLDFMVGGFAVLFGIIGLMILIKPDLNRLFNNLKDTIGPAAETAAETAAV